MRTRATDMLLLLMQWPAMACLGQKIVLVLGKANISLKSKCTPIPPAKKLNTTTKKKEDRKMHIHKKRLVLKASVRPVLPLKIGNEFFQTGDNELVEHCGISEFCVRLTLCNSVKWGRSCILHGNEQDKSKFRGFSYSPQEFSLLKRRK